LQELTTEAKRRAHLGDAPLTVLRRLVDALGVSALVADNAGSYILTNADASDLTGYSADELRRISVWQLTADANDHEAETLWRAFLLQGEQRGDYPLLTKNGHIVTAEYAARAHVLPNLHVSLLRRRDSPWTPSDQRHGPDHESDGRDGRQHADHANDGQSRVSVNARSVRTRTPNEKLQGR
jgi:PAS domain S-box-containing protein